MAKPGTDRLGWCLDGHHDNCPGEVFLSVQNKNHKCGCDCHGKEK